MATSKNSRKQPLNEETQSSPQELRKSAVAPIATHATAILTSERQERLDMLARVPSETRLTSHLATTNYHVDRSIREASLAHRDQWQEEEEMLVFISSNKLKVYLGTRRAPLDVDEALIRIRALSESTALTARIVLGIWNIRRANNQLAKNGSVAMRLEEVLEWRGIKKHSYAAFPGSEKRYTDGYETRYKEQVLRDLDLLATCYVRGRVNGTFKGKPIKINIDSSYLNYSIVSQETLWNSDVIAGVFVNPGDWINAYTEQGSFFLAETDRRIFMLNPQNEQHELRLGLYLTERWRETARDGTFNQPISMADLLAASIIPIDKHNLTSRFAPRIENALNTLWEKEFWAQHPFVLMKSTKRKANGEKTGSLLDGYLSLLLKCNNFTKRHFGTPNLSKYHKRPGKHIQKNHHRKLYPHDGRGKFHAQSSIILRTLSMIDISSGLQAK